MKLLENIIDRMITEILEKSQGSSHVSAQRCSAALCCSGLRILDERYPERWIGRKAAIGWPTRSPDLNSLDFFSVVI